MSSLPIETESPRASGRVAPRNAVAATAEPAWVRRTLIGVALVFLTLFLFVPLVSVFFEAFKKGFETYLGDGSEVGLEALLERLEEHRHQGHE